MSAPAIFDITLIEALGWGLVHLLWQATAVAGIVALILPRQRSADARYATACAALGVILLFFVATVLRNYGASDPAGAEIMASGERYAGATPGGAVTQPRPAAALQDLLPWLVALWSAGVAFFSARLCASWLQSRDLVRRGARAASEDWQRVAARLSSSLGLPKAVLLLESSLVEGPCALGFLKPVILFPVSALAGLTVQQVEMVLAHELAHIRRHDYLVNLLQTVMETLMFYHPAVWWISRRVRIERENCCDDLAIAVCGSPVQYARALARLEELRARPVPPLAMAANGGALLQRVRRIAGGPGEVPFTGSLWMGGLPLLAAAGAAALLPLVSSSASVPGVTLAAGERTNLPMAASAKASSFGAAREEWRRGRVAPALRVAAQSQGNRKQVGSTSFVEDRSSAIGTRQRPDEPAPTIDELIALGAAGVTPEYVKEMRAVLPDLMNASGKGRKPVSAEAPQREVIREVIREVTGKQVVKVRREISSSALERVVPDLRRTGVTAEYVREMRAAGANIDTPSDALKLRRAGVTPAFLQQLKAAGYTDLSVHDLSKKAGAGTNGDLVAEMEAYRTRP